MTCYIQNPDASFNSLLYILTMIAIPSYILTMSRSDPFCFQNAHKPTPLLIQTRRGLNRCEFRDLAGAVLLTPAKSG
jgi:hypothetical protein